VSHVGDLVSYYLRHLGDIDIVNGHTVGLSIIHAALSLITCLALLALASLTIRARPDNHGRRTEIPQVVCKNIGARSRQNRLHRVMVQR